MDKQLPITTNSLSPANTNISVNINMSECEYVKTKNRTVTASLDLRTGAQFQYTTNEQIMMKNKK